MSRFIQTGDIHIGACRSLEGYLDRHKAVLTQIMDLAYNKGLPLFITGDLTHSKTTTHDESYLLHWWFSEIDKRKIFTVVIGGNHDHLYGEVTQLHELQCMPFKHIKIVPWHPETHVINDIGVICVPWRNYSSEDLKRVVLEKLPLVSSSTYKVIMLHECISGVKLDSGLILTKGVSLPYIPEITYWAVGDIHKYQATNVANGFYSGSPMQFNFDDTLPKGVIEIDLKHPSLEPTFHSLVFKPLKTVHSVKEIKEDAYYKLVGGYEEVIEANKEKLVVRTEYDNSKEALKDYVKVGIVDGLAEFLAKKGIDEDLQRKGIEWVSSLLNLKSDTNYAKFS